MTGTMLITVEEAAERLGLGRTFTYTLIRRGDLPSVKVGGARRVAVVDLEQFIDRVREQGEIVIGG